MAEDTTESERWCKVATIAVQPGAEFKLAANEQVIDAEWDGDVGLVYLVTLTSTPLDYGEMRDDGRHRK